MCPPFAWTASVTRFQPATCSSLKHHDLTFLGFLQLACLNVLVGRLVISYITTLRYSEGDNDEQVHLELTVIMTTSVLSIRAALQAMAPSPARP